MPRPFFPFRSRLWPVLFFVGLLALGLGTARDFGLSIDAPTNHYFGVTWYHYVRDIVVHHAPVASFASATEHDVVHGPFFEMTLAWIEDAILKISDIRQILLFRNYATWVTFCGGVLCCYFLGRRLFGNRLLALLASLFLAIHPRIFSHAFFDSVDIPFLVFYTASVLTLVRYLDRRTLGTLAVHAVTCALAIDIRSMAGVIPVLTVCLLALDWIAPKTPVSLKRRTLPAISHIAFFAVVVAVTMIVFWPYLWTNPFQRALDVIHQTPKVNWSGPLLYLGHEANAAELPWHYIPVWILITTPVTCSCFFFVGLLELLFFTVRHPVAAYRERLNELVVLAAFLVPLAAVILLHAIVYDSWRHLFFIYPAFVLISVNGLRKAFTWGQAVLSPRPAHFVKALAAVTIALDLTFVAGFMIKNHPNEHVYFNRLAGSSMTEIRTRFEMDYWGISYRQALEYVMKTDSANPIKISHGDYDMLSKNVLLLPAADQARIQQVGVDQADYVITNFRMLREGYPTLPEYFSIKVGGAKILCVYRKKSPPTP